MDFFALQGGQMNLEKPARDGGDRTRLCNGFSGCTRTLLSGLGMFCGSELDLEFLRGGGLDLRFPTNEFPAGGACCLLTESCTPRAGGPRYGPRASEGASSPDL